MSERSVAEIIGWEWREVAGGRGYWLHPDGVTWMRPRPTVDQMLAWLRTRGETRIEAWDYDGGFAVHVEVGKIYEGPHPTLLAALEAAVRAVEEAP